MASEQESGGGGFGATDADINVMVTHVLRKSWNKIGANLSSWQKNELENVGSSENGIKCLLQMWFVVYKNMAKGTYCNATWDSHYCWPPTLAGSTVTRNCSSAFRESQPVYASHLQGNAFRVCQANGTWLRGDWTNYTECADSYDDFVSRSEEGQQLKDQVRYIVFIGSILSLFCLLTAISIFCCFKSIWCDRVTIHIHLMAALTLRYILLCVITEPFIFNRVNNYRDTDWVCKMVLLVYLYATVTSVNWMFIQGVYLNGKLTTNVFDKAAPFKLYYTFGWLIPVPLLGVYAIVMETYHPLKCWKGYSEMSEIWIILSPILIALLVNLALLINILRVLLTKVHRASPSSDAIQFQRAAKATIILSPILGINNLLFIYNPGGIYHKFYVILNSLFGSTQGVFVALVYCYLSSDVCSAIRRVYRRFLARRNANRCRLQQRRANSCSTSSGLIVEQPVYLNRCRTFSRSNPNLSSVSVQQTTFSPGSNRRNISALSRHPRRNMGFNNNNINNNFLCTPATLNGIRSGGESGGESSSGENWYSLQHHNPFLSRSQNLGVETTAFVGGCGHMMMGGESHLGNNDVIIPLSELV